MEATAIETIPTSATYVLTAGLVVWIKDAARAEGKSASEFVRDIIDTARLRCDLFPRESDEERVA